MRQDYIPDESVHRHRRNTELAEIRMRRKEKFAWYKKEFEEIRNIIEHADSLSHYDFLRIRNFKLQNTSPEPEHQIREKTRAAFIEAERDNIRRAITILTELEGVAIPIASTILAMRYPESFAIIDSRVIRQLQKDHWIPAYLHDPVVYEEYLLLLRDLSQKRGIPLRELERSLFEKE